MVTEDHTGMDFLFPSSQTALEIYEAQHGKPVKSEIVLNTPIVIYARAAVTDALLAEGIAQEERRCLLCGYGKARRLYRGGNALVRDWPA